MVLWTAATCKTSSLMLHLALQIEKEPSMWLVKKFKLPIIDAYQQQTSLLSWMASSLNQPDGIGSLVYTPKEEKSNCCIFSSLDHSYVATKSILLNHLPCSFSGAVSETYMIGVLSEQRADCSSSSSSWSSNNDAVKKPRIWFCLSISCLEIRSVYKITKAAERIRTRKMHRLVITSQGHTRKQKNNPTCSQRIKMPMSDWWQ